MANGVFHFLTTHRFTQLQVRARVGQTVLRGEYRPVNRKELRELIFSCCFVFDVLLGSSVFLVYAWNLHRVACLFPPKSI